MSENDNIQRLNEISATVNKRDMTIWENAAHSICIRKETEKLKNEIARMERAISEKKKETEMLKTHLADIEKSVDIEQNTLKTIEQCIVTETVFKEMLLQDVLDYQNKYAKTLEMYNDQLKEYRSIYENASGGYKELKEKQIELKKLSVENMILDGKIKHFENSQKLYKKIQQDLFYKTIVKFAQLYISFNKKASLKAELQMKKKEEQQLLREHFQMSESAKREKHDELRKIHFVNKSLPKQEPTPVKVSEFTKKTDEQNTDILQRYLNEDIPSCSLTSVNLDKKIAFNEDQSKVKILDMKIMKPRINQVKHPKPEFRKKMEHIMKTTKEELKRNNSFQINKLNIQEKRIYTNQNNEISNSQQSEKNQNGSQIKSSTPKQEKVAELKTQTNSILPNIEESKIDCNVVASQKEKSHISTPPALVTVKLTCANVSQSKDMPKEAVNSILKTSSQNCEKRDNKKNKENDATFFATKKKTVTFHNEIEKNVTHEEPNNFQFSSKQKKNVPGVMVKSIDVFQKPMFIKNDRLSQVDRNIKEMSIMYENDVQVSDSTNCTTEAGMTSDLCVIESDEEKAEMTFTSLENSFNPNFGHITENFSSALDNNTFSFFGSANKTTNPFSFF